MNESMVHGRKVRKTGRQSVKVKEMKDERGK
jgi:hypothetical protein